MKIAKLKSFIILVFILNSIPAQSQVNGSSGGGGPSRDGLKANCTIWLEITTELEKSFVQKKGQKYKTQDDFFKQLNIIVGSELGKSIMKINSPTPACPKETLNEELTILKKIREIWNLGFAVNKHCLGMFTQRYRYADSLDAVIQIYCAESGNRKKPNEEK